MKRLLFNRSKTSLAILFPLLLSLAYSQAAMGDVLFQTGWEYGPLGRSGVTDPGNPYGSMSEIANTDQYGLGYVDAVNPFDGSKSLRIDWEKHGSSGVGGACEWYVATPHVMSGHHEYYVGWAMKYDTNWENCPGRKLLYRIGGDQHSLFFQGTQGYNCGQGLTRGNFFFKNKANTIDDDWNQPRGEKLAYGGPRCNTYGGDPCAPWPGCEDPILHDSDGQWHTIILHVREHPTDGVFTFWFDGHRVIHADKNAWNNTDTLADGPCAVNYFDNRESDFHAFKFPTYFNFGPPNHDQSEWWDNFIIATTFEEVAEYLNTSGTGDDQSPFTSGHNPAKGASGVAADSNIIVHIQDSGDGVDQASIVMSVNGAMVSPAISGSSADYTVTYDPPDDFPRGQEVTITIDAQDLHDPPNVMSQDSYIFTVAVAPDTTDPVINITQPTSGGTYSTDQSAIALAGTASDNVGVTSVVWVNDRGGNGTASGTTNWAISNVPLQEGNNEITVTAHDAAGNTAADTLTVTYTPPSGTYTEEFGSATGTGTSQDAYINLNTTNYSSENPLKTYTWPQDQVANAIIMKWDLSAIPASATIQDATLFLYLSSISGDGGDDPYELSVHKMVNYNPVISSCTGHAYDGTNSWTPNSQCYNNVPMAQGDIALAEDTEAIDKTYGYVSWSVTNMVQDWVSDSGSNYGMLVNSDPVASSDSNRYFSSTESSNPDQRPKLTVTYSVGEEPDTTAPVVAITSPTSGDSYSTNQDSINMSGSASDNVGVTGVTWTNNRGGNGTASGTETWAVSGITLPCGDDNIITVTAQDAAGNSGTDTLNVDVKPCTPLGLDVQ